MLHTQLKPEVYTEVRVILSCFQWIQGFLKAKKGRPGGRPFKIYFNIKCSNLLRYLCLHLNKSAPFFIPG